MYEDVSAPGHHEDVCSLLGTEEAQASLESFGKSVCEAGATAQFWWHYMEMVSILLRFTRAQREGNWDLHLHAFKEMMPYFHAYNHNNYARLAIIGGSKY